MATAGKVIECRAAVSWAAKEPLSVETVFVDPPQAGEVRVKVLATSLCHSDLGVVQGKTQHPFPCILGHEGGGIVESVGEGVTTVKPGDKVLTSFGPNCRKCRSCVTKTSNTCLEPLIQGGLKNLARPVLSGGTTRFKSKDGQVIYHFAGCSSFSEYTVIPETSAVKIAGNSPLDKVCLYACCLPTGYGAAFNSANIFPGASVAVFGLGAVGLSAVIGAKAAKAGQIIAVDINPNKKDIAIKHGATDFVNPNDLTVPVQQKLRELSGGFGVDRSIVCVGILEVMKSGIEAATIAGGTLVMVGVPGTGTTLDVSTAGIIFGKKVVGSLLGGFYTRDDFPNLVEMYLRGELQTDDLITHNVTLDGINEAVELLEKGKSIRTVITLASE